MHALSYPTLVVVQSNVDDGLTFSELLARIPHDPASIFTFLLLAGSVTLVLWAGRNKGGSAA